jgi:hypothetical protein
MNSIDHKKYTRVIIFIFTLLTLWPFFNSLSNSNDFEIFMGAANRFRDHLEMYDSKVVYERYLHYYYSPLFTFLLQPFAQLPVYRFPADSMLPNILLSMLCAKLVWNTLNLFFIYRIVKIILDIFSFKNPSTQILFYSILMFLGYRWLHINIRYGQLTIFLLFGILEAFCNPKANKWLKWWPMIIAINIKILPIFMYVKLFFDKRIKVMVGIFLGVLFVTFIPWFFIDKAYFMRELVSWLHAINPVKTSHVVQVGEGGFMDIGAILTKYFTSINAPREYFIYFTKLSVSQLFWLTQILRMAFLWLITYLILEIKKIPQNNFSNYVQVSLVCIGIPLIFPHQRDYSFAFYIPALTVVVFYYLQNKTLFGVFQKTIFFTSLLFMGCLVFFEIFSIETRYLIIGLRTQGIGAILFAIGYFRLIYQLKDKELTGSF